MKTWKCSVCGCAREGDFPPEECPICSAPSGKFAEVEAKKAP